MWDDGATQGGSEIAESCCINNMKAYKQPSLKYREYSSLIHAGILFWGLCAECDLFENSLGGNSKNSLRSLTTGLERLEELRLDSLEESLKHTESNTEKPIEESKGNNLFAMSVADRTSNEPKKPKNLGVIYII